MANGGEDEVGGIAFAPLEMATAEMSVGLQATLQEAEDASFGVI